MLDNEEYRAQVGLTAAFIEADYSIVSVIRPVRKTDGHGGFKDLIPDIPSHSVGCRMIPQESEQSNAANQISTPDGERHDPRYVCMCLPDADLRLGDIVIWQGDKWRLRARHIGASYEQKFDVVKYVGR